MKNIDQRPVAARYLLPLVAVCLGTVAYWMLEPLLEGRVLYMFYFPAVLLSAWYGGFGPGILATLAGAAAAPYFFLQPDLAWGPLPLPEIVGDVLFLVMGGLVSAVVGNLHVARTRTESARAEVEQHLVARTEAESRFRVAADRAPVMIWMADADGGRDWFNHRWLDFTGSTLEAQTGEGWTEGIHPEDRESCVSSYAAAVGERQAVTLEYRLRRRDGEHRWVLDEGLPRITAGGGFSGYIGSALVIHERKEIEDQQQQLLATAEAASRAKDEFLGVVSHELRTPLNAILTWSQLLASEEGRRRLDQGLEVIRRNVRLQIDLVDQLLDFSRLVSGRMEISREEVHLGAVVGAAAEEVGSEATEKGIDVKVSVSSGAGPVLGDERRLRQVVSHLLRNAVKFTPEEGTVEVEVARRGEEVEIRVVDSGVGIRPEFLPHVFERFRQLDASTRRKYGGLGLGLALVRELVELHGGRVRAESGGPGRGSSFVVSLPALISHQEPGSGRPADVPDLAGVRVLVVEDDPDARETLCLVLERTGAQVAATASGYEAIEVWQAGRFDVLLSDLGLPELDGYELLERLRRGNGEIPAAAVTAFVSPEDRRRAAEAGFAAFLEKPLDLQRLLTTVAALAGRLDEGDRDPDPESEPPGRNL